MSAENPLEGMEHYAEMAKRIAENPDIKPQIFAIGKQLHSDWMAYQGVAGMVRKLADFGLESGVLEKTLGVGEGFMAKAGLKRLTQMVPENLPPGFEALPPPAVLNLASLVCNCPRKATKAGDVGPHHDSTCPKFCSATELP